MEINNPLIPIRVRKLDGGLIRFAQVDIGPWNMDSTVLKIVGIPVAGMKVVSVTVQIIRDTGDAYFALAGFDDSTARDGGWRMYAAQINLERTTGGYFDGANFVNGVINRGQIFLIYLE